LFRGALGKKGNKKYSSDVRKELTLLIDANPIARMSDFVSGIENVIAPLARQAGYQAVWAVGTADACKLD
jgi:hypothetical protein